MTSWMRLISQSWRAAGIVCVAASLGCGKAPAVDTEMVEGLVTLDGSPVAGATVTFIPVQEGAGAAATGMTDPSGKYVLNAVGAGIGARPGAGTLPGEYYVGVMKVNVPGPPKGEYGKDSPALAKQRPKDAALTHVVPQKFNDAKKSGIKVSVKTGINNIPIELKSK